MVVGSALAAFITILDLVPRLLQLIKTTSAVTLAEAVLVMGATAGSLLSFFTPRVSLGQVTAMVVGLCSGTFIGLLAAALAEVLDVIPVIARRLHMLQHTGKIVSAIVLGKVVGSLLQWTYLGR